MLQASAAHSSGTMMIKALFAIGFSLIPSLAFAHTGAGVAHDHGFGALSGFLHPFSGIDHLLAMIAVGMMAASFGGRALWLLPLSFLTMMAFSGLLGMAGLGLPFVEIGIGLSVVIFGLLVAKGIKMPIAAAMGLIGFFALFHGHAHGAEMPEAASILAYGLAFLSATALLHGLGIGLALCGAKLSETSALRLRQAAGSAMGLAGLALLIAAF